MQQRRRCSRIILGLMTLGLLAGAALTAPPAQAQVAGPYYAEPAWDQSLPAATRFVVLTNWASAAVLDKETGLVWERSPAPTNNFTWDAARKTCTALTTGRRKGWRLPSMDELASLVDTTQVGPALPAGHPFVISLPIVNIHWSATTGASSPLLAWTGNFFNGSQSLGDKTGGGNAWCVRGGNNTAAY